MAYNKQNVFTDKYLFNSWEHRIFSRILLMEENCDSDHEMSGNSHKDHNICDANENRKQFFSAQELH